MYPYNRLRRQVYNEKRKRGLVFYTVALVVISYLLWTLVFDDSGYLRYRTLNEKRQEVLTEIVKLQKDNAGLKGEIRLLAKDPFYVEKQAREELNLSRPDEYVFIFQD